jgi:hypothetical protein
VVDMGILAALPLHWCQPEAYLTLYTCVNPSLSNPELILSD